MSSAPAKIFIDAPTKHSSRLRVAIDDLNRYAVSPDYGASLEQLRAVHEARKAQRATRGAPASVEGDLVTKLLTDPDLTGLWSELLNNAFCKSMGETGTDDAGAEALLRGFKAYMVQDYIYCARGIKYQTDRAIKSTTAKDFDVTKDKVKSYADYAWSALQLCVNAPTDASNPGLGLQDQLVLEAQPADVLNEYTGFQIQTAETHNWVMSLVAMIPCIQSYYAIAKPLYDKAPEKIKNTQWYKLWIEPNGNVDEDQAGVSGQKTFFITNYAVWKDHYAEAKETFRRACQGEINLWKFAQDAKA